MEWVALNLIYTAYSQTFNNHNPSLFIFIRYYLRLNLWWSTVCAHLKFDWHYLISNLRQPKVTPELESFGIIKLCHINSEFLVTSHLKGTLCDLAVSVRFDFCLKSLASPFDPLAARPWIHGKKARSLETTRGSLRLKKTTTKHSKPGSSQSPTTWLEKWTLSWSKL